MTDTHSTEGKQPECRKVDEPDSMHRTGKNMKM